jgi:Cd2+/Zn2+-exporting ATPase
LAYEVDAVTTRSLDLPVLLPRGAECAGCVDELTGALGRVDGVSEVEADLARGLLHVSFDTGKVGFDDLTRDARRIGAQAHCREHCPDGVCEHGSADLCITFPEEPAYEQRLCHVTGLDCADCALKLETALRNTTGVVDATTSFGASTLKVTYDPGVIAFDGVLDRVDRLGYGTVEGEAARTAARPRRLAFDVAGMDCADCAAKLETRLGRLPGVSDVRVDFATARLTAVAASAPAGALATTAAQMGYRLTPAGEQAAARAWYRDTRTVLTAVSGAAVVGGFAAEAAAPAAAPFLFAAAAVTGGAFTARAAFYSLRARSLDMNVLMTLAAVGAAAIGQWAEAGLVMFLFSLGNLLQSLTMERTRDAVRRLARLTPDAIEVVGADGVRTVAVADLLVGDLVRVRPGGRLPVDGIVTDGAAAVDQSAVTGESMPLPREPGDEVFAGSIVQGGALTVRVATTGGDTTIAHIVHLVEEAQAQRAPVQTTVDRFAARYTPVVIALAAAVMLVPPLVFGQPFDTWFYRGLALLIISCPCALVISTPVSILAALGAATRRGVLVKGGAYLEQARRLRAVAFDKTGTLTLGRPVVTEVVAFDGTTGERVLATAAACERGSEHALARAIVAAASGGGDPARRTDDHDGAAAHDRDPGPGHVHSRDHDHAHEAVADAAIPTATRFRALAGQGVRADVGGETWLVGRPDLFPSGDGWTAELGRLEAGGATVVVVGTPERVAGLIAVADAVRPGAREALADLRTQGVERVVMLTGDNEATARSVGAAAGVDEVRAGLLPADKVGVVRDLEAAYGATAMVGDGVNDAPALAAASLGVAMGAAGTDAALDTADIALMGDDLSAVADTMRLSRRTTTIIGENIAFSIAVKAVFLVLAPLGFVSLWMAVVADMGTSLAVIFNGLRLRRG